MIAGIAAEAELALTAERHEDAVDEVQVAAEVQVDEELLAEVLSLTLTMMLAMNLMVVGWPLPQLMKP